MAEIRKHLEKHEETTIITVTGKVTSDEVIAALNEFYGSGFTLNLIWDFTGAELPLSATEKLSPLLSKILMIAKSHAHLRKDGRTAIVLPDVFGYGVGRMYEILSEVEGHPIAHGIFKTVNEARSWMGLSSGQ